MAQFEVKHDDGVYILGQVSSEYISSAREEFQ